MKKILLLMILLIISIVFLHAQTPPSVAEAEIYRLQAMEYLDKKDYDRAIEIFTQAINIDPDYARAYMNRGSVYQEKGAYELALRDFNQAIKLDLNYSNALLNRGYFYMKNGKDELALSDLTKAIELDPNNAQAYCNRGVIYFNRGNYAYALADFEAAVKINPNNKDYTNNREIARNKRFEEEKKKALIRNNITDIDELWTMKTVGAKGFPTTPKGSGSGHIVYQKQYNNSDYVILEQDMYFKWLYAYHVYVALSERQALALLEEYKEDAEKYFERPGNGNAWSNEKQTFYLETQGNEFIMFITWK
jgi:Tfp pilus assembly protein PilF